MWLILPLSSHRATILRNTFRSIEDSFPIEAVYGEGSSVAVGSIAASWAVSSLLIMVPGADWAFTISAGLGGHSVVQAVGGIVLGYAAMTIAVAAGVGTLVARAPALLTALTIAGGLYLIWHGATTFARPSA